MALVLITGATDGIGLETARQLLAQDHTVLLHGRHQARAEACRESLAKTLP